MRILIMCTVIMLPISVFAQRRNLDIVDSLVYLTVQQIQKHLSEQAAILSPNDTLRVHVVPHGAQWLVEQHLFALPFPLRRLQRTDSQTTHLTIRTVDCGVRYFNQEHNDEMLTREIQILLTLTAEKSTGVVTRLPNVAAFYRDSIYRSMLPLLETQHYEFTRGAVPTPPGTLFRSLLEPIIVVASAVVVLLLLFTVRSQ